MGYSTALFAMSAVQAVNQIGEGIVQKAQYDAAATIAETEGEMVQYQGDVLQGQMRRERGTVLAESTAIAAKQGVGLQGSTMAVIVGTQRQMLIDAAIARAVITRAKVFFILS